MINVKLPSAADKGRSGSSVIRHCGYRLRAGSYGLQRSRITIIAAAVRMRRRSEYQKYGCRIIVTEHARWKSGFKELMRQLGQTGSSVLLEGGAMLNWSALKPGSSMRCMRMAPKLFVEQMPKVGCGE